METELEFEWLTSLLTGRPTSELREPDWDQFTQLALFHRVVPFLPQLDRFEPLIQRNLFRGMQLAGHLQSLRTELEEKDVSFLILKGLALAESLYGGLGKRAAGDIDLWIAEESLPAVHQTLTDSGHVPKTGYALLSPHYQKLYREKKFHIGYVHEQSSISVEIHWRIGGTLELFPISFEQAYDRSTSVTIAQSRYQTLGDMDNLIFLHIHAARHLWERLFWIQDLVKFHQSPSAPSIDEVIEQASTLGLVRPVLAGLKVTDQCLSMGLATNRSQMMAMSDPGIEWIARSGYRKLTKPLGELGRASSIGSLVANWRMHRSFSHSRAAVSEWLCAADDWHLLPLPDGMGMLYPFARPLTRTLRKWSKRD